MYGPNVLLASTMSQNQNSTMSFQDDDGDQSDQSSHSSLALGELQSLANSVGGVTLQKWDDNVYWSITYADDGWIFALNSNPTSVTRDGIEFHGLNPTEALAHVDLRLLAKYLMDQHTRSDSIRIMSADFNFGFDSQVELLSAHASFFPRVEPPCV